MHIFRTVILNSTFSIKYIYDDRVDSALKPLGGNSVPCSLFIDSHITQKAGAAATHPLKRFLKLISICILRVDDEHLPSNTCTDCASVALFKREDLFACGCHTHAHARTQVWCCCSCCFLYWNSAEPGPKPFSPQSSTPRTEEFTARSRSEGSPEGLAVYALGL